MARYTEYYQPREIRNGVLHVSTDMGSIPKYRYRENESIRAIYVDDGFCKVENGAFFKCTNLEKVLLPDSLEEIGMDLFGFCGNLEEVRLGNKVRSIGAGAFFSCKKLKEIRLPDTVRRIGACAFSYCSGLREVVLPEGVLELEKYCFADCTGLQSISIPAGVQKIGTGAFGCCGNQLDLRVHPDNPWFRAENGMLLSKDGRILYGCAAASGAVSVPDGVEEIRERALGDNRITHISLPDSLRRIGRRGFIFANSLTSITLPEGLQSIGEDAFANSKITELVVPESVEQMGDDVLRGCKVRHLVLRGSETAVGRVCHAEDLQPDAMLTADGLEIEDYPEPFSAVHGLRSAAARYLAGETVPEAVMERFRTYLAKHYRQHWDEPNIFALTVALKVLPKESMKEAIRRATELNNPAVTAALLQDQHERFPQGQTCRRCKA